MLKILCGRNPRAHFSTRPPQAGSLEEYTLCVLDREIKKGLLKGDELVLVLISILTVMRLVILNLSRFARILANLAKSKIW